MTQTLVGKIAPLVTGATRGIGRASAVALGLVVRCLPKVTPRNARVISMSYEFRLIATH